MTTVQPAAKPLAQEPPPADEKPIVVVDLGRRKKKQIKRLRNGHGRLMDRVADTVDQLKADEAIESDAQIVVVVVRQDDKRKGLFS